jgi:two-component system chemotaxis response regulator CheB
MKKFTENGSEFGTYEAVVIGTSSGGMDALTTLLSVLSDTLVLSTIIVQHMHPHSDDFLARHLHEICQLTVKQAEEKEPIAPGIVYIAPANYHLLIEADKTFSLSNTKRVNYARPSIDVLFETAADVYGARLIGIILTGANNDGSQGLKTIKECGGLTIVQDPATAEADSMPKAAIEATTVDYVLSLQEIGVLLNRIGGELNVPHAPSLASHTQAGFLS